MNSKAVLKGVLVLVLLIGLVSANNNQQCTQDGQHCVGNEHDLIQMQSAGAINKTLDAGATPSITEVVSIVMQLSQYASNPEDALEDPELIQQVLDLMQPYLDTLGVKPDAASTQQILGVVMALSHYASNPEDALRDPELRQQVVDLLKPYIMNSDIISSALEPLQPYLDRWNLTADAMVLQYLSCTTQTSCGSCTNKLALCYWCSQSQSCHPVGSAQLQFGMSPPECTEYNCKSQWPSSSCKSAYCPDGSSVGMDDGPCGARMTCDSCMNGNCFWCGISGSCHQVGSQFYDPRCTNSNCQSEAWLSTCSSKTCSDAVAYEEST